MHTLYKINYFMIALQQQPTITKKQIIYDKNKRKK